MAGVTTRTSSQDPLLTPPESVSLFPEEKDTQGHDTWRSVNPRVNVQVRDRNDEHPTHWSPLSELVRPGDMTLTPTTKPRRTKNPDLLSTEGGTHSPHSTQVEGFRVVCEGGQEGHLGLWEKARLRDRRFSYLVKYFHSSTSGRPGPRRRSPWRKGHGWTEGVNRPKSVVTRRLDVTTADHGPERDSTWTYTGDGVGTGERLGEGRTRGDAGRVPVRGRSGSRGGAHHGGRGSSTRTGWTCSRTSDTNRHRNSSSSCTST